MNRALTIGAQMAVQYFLVCLNMRAVAVRSYVGTLSTDAAIAANGFALLRSAVHADTWAEKIAYVVGGCVGSALALWSGVI